MQTPTEADMAINTNTNTHPKLFMFCSKHGQQTAINMKGLQTEHLILGCGCAYQLTDGGPLYDGNTNEEPKFFEEARQCFVDARAIEVPADEYFRRLETIGRGTPEVENWLSAEAITSTVQSGFAHVR